MGMVEDTVVKAKEAFDVAAKKTNEVIALQKLKVSASAVNSQMTKAYGVKQAPTLIVPNGDSYKTYENASLIKGYIDEASKN